MPKSHAVAWDENAPSPAQLKEFFAQIETKTITHDRLQALLRREIPESGDFITWFDERQAIGLRQIGHSEKWDMIPAPFITTVADFEAFIFFLVKVGIFKPCSFPEKCALGYAARIH